MQVRDVEESRDAGDVWTSASWRIMFMFCSHDGMSLRWTDLLHEHLPATVCSDSEAVLHTFK